MDATTNEGMSSTSVQSVVRDQKRGLWGAGGGPYIRMGDGMLCPLAGNDGVGVQGWLLSAKSKKGNQGRQERPDGDSHSCPACRGWQQQILQSDKKPTLFTLGLEIGASPASYLAGCENQSW